MNRLAATIGYLVVVMTMATAIAARAQAQVPVKPAPRAFVPITVAVNIDAATAQIIKEMERVQNLPPILSKNSPLFKRPLFKKLREQKPLRKLLVVLMEKIKLIPELEKLAQPIPVGEDRWLNLNLTEVVYRQTELKTNGVNQLALIQLAVHMKPDIVLSKAKPAVPPLPQISMGQPNLPPPGSGTPIDIALKIDPKVIPQVLPPDAKRELDKYGIDPTQVKFSNRIAGQNKLLVFDVPIKKPLSADLEVSFIPEVENNVLTFAEPTCKVSTKTAPGAKNNSVQDALQQFTQNTIKTFVVGKMKKTTVDFTPHLEKVTDAPLGPPGAANKVQASFENLRVESVQAEWDLLVFHISGVVGKGGIIIHAP